MLLKNGVVKTQADLARTEGISRVSVTRTMSLLRLAPEIQEYLLSPTNENQINFFTKKRLRRITQIKDHQTQLAKFEELKRRTGI